MYRAPYAALGLILTLIGTADAEQWTRFRGPSAGAVPDDPGLPETWSETENVV